MMEAAHGANEREYKRILEAEGYTGWLHISAVQAIPGGYSWTVTSDLYRDGVVIRRSRLGAWDGYRAEARDIAMAAASQAVEAALHSRGGEAIHAD